jgi:hypothetical protein
MENTIFEEQVSTKETEKIKFEVNKIFDEVKRSQEKMDTYQKDIDRMKIKTRTILEQLEKAA